MDVLAPVVGWWPGRLPVFPPPLLPPVRPRTTEICDYDSKTKAIPLYGKKKFFYQHYKIRKNFATHYSASQVRPHPSGRLILDKKFFIIHIYRLHRSFRLTILHLGFSLKRFLALQFFLPQATSQPIFFWRFIIRRWTRHCTPIRPLLGVRAGRFINVAIRSFPFHALNKAKWSYVEVPTTSAKRRPRSRIGRAFGV